MAGSKVFCLQLRHWLLHDELRTIEQIGEELGSEWSHSLELTDRRWADRGVAVPINVKDRDTFHLTIEEYLLALTNTIEELVCDVHSQATATPIQYPVLDGVTSADQSELKTRPFRLLIVQALTVVHPT